MPRVSALAPYQASLWIFKVMTGPPSPLISVTYEIVSRPAQIIITNSFQLKKLHLDAITRIADDSWYGLYDTNKAEEISTAKARKEDIEIC